MQLLIDERFAEKVIPANDSVRLLDRIVEEMDLSELERAYDVRGRKPATEPSIMLKILLYANMENIYSSRRIQASCQRDINYIWLLNGAPAPSYHEIARFRSRRMTQCAEELLFQLVEKLSDYGEIKYEHLFVDGTKIEANANKYSFVWKKSTTKYEARNNGKLEAAIETLSAKHGVLCTEAEKLLEVLREKVTEPFVHGRGHRKSELQRDIELLQGLLEKRKKYTGYQETFKGRNSFSKTDPDATFMHMKEDHMRNAQLKPGYNIQFGVEGEYFTGVSVSSERSDQLTLIPFMENLRSHGIEYTDVTADAGYESEENYSYFESIPAECYITKSGYEREVTYYECDDCSQCQFKKRCTRAKGNRKLQVSKKFIAQRSASLERITSPEGIQLRKTARSSLKGLSESSSRIMAFDSFCSGEIKRSQRKSCCLPCLTTYTNCIPKYRIIV